MNTELCEIIEYLKENYREDYKEILLILKKVHEKIKEDIKKSVDEGNYTKMNELGGCAEKFNVVDFSGITYEKDNIIEPIYAEKHELSPSLCDGIELSLSDVWTSYIPVQFVFEGLTEKVFGIWKDLFTGVLRELFRKDYKTFERMVLNNAVRGRQYQLFSQKDIGKEYSQIPNTGYFYRSYGLSPEQMRTYLQRVFEYFEISSDKLKVYVDAEKKRKSKNIKKDNEVENKVAYIVGQEIIKNKQCPLCKNLMNKYQLKISNTINSEFNELYSMLCSNCDRVYVSEKVYRPYIRGNKPEWLDVKFKQL